MKYIITAMNVRDGNDHVTDPTKRTEIATEMVMTRLKAIEMLNRGYISRDDCIVTRSERECLYTNIFKNVINWEQYIDRDFMDEFHKEEGAPDIINLAANIDLLDKTMRWYPFYQRYEQDKAQIHDIQLGKAAFTRRLPIPFVVIVNRQTPNHPEKNLPMEYWHRFFECIDKQFPGVGLGGRLEFFVMGTPIEYRPGSTHIGFQSAVSAMANPNCRVVLSTCSGGVYPIFFTGHEKSKLFIIDNNRLVEKFGYSPSFYNDCINFTKTQKKIIDYVPEPIDLATQLFEFAEIQYEKI